MKKLVLILTIVMVPLSPYLRDVSAVVLATENKTILVFDFKSMVAHQEYGMGIAEILRAELATLHDSPIVVQKGVLQKVLKEQNLPAETRFVDDATALEVGRRLRAGRVIVGSVVKFGKTFTINSRAINVETGHVTVAQIFRVESEDELSSMVRKLALELTKQPLVAAARKGSPKEKPEVQSPNVAQPVEGGVERDGAYIQMGYVPPGSSVLGDDGDDKRGNRTYEGMVYIPAGPFFLGSNDGNGAEKPMHQVNIKGFFIDKYEVTNKQYYELMQATQRAAPKYWQDSDLNQPNLPVVGVTWFDANTYCQWVKKRLPLEEEWEKAARGRNGLSASQPYPWENTSLKDGGNFRANYDPGNFAEDKYAKLAPVGSFPAGAAVWEGGKVYDVVGNVREWTASWFVPYPKSRSGKNHTDKNRTDKVNYVVRGGSWRDSASFTRISIRGGWRPQSAQSYLGFRCARD